jgi:hypothetical protein
MKTIKLKKTQIINNKELLLIFLFNFELGKQQSGNYKQDQNSRGLN